MKTIKNFSSKAQISPPTRSPWVWLLIVAAVLGLLIALVHERQSKKSGSSGVTVDNARTGSQLNFSVGRELPAPRGSVAVPPLSAEEIVTGKVSQFGRSRREIARGIGRRLGKEVPPEVEKFFDAIERGQWEEIKTQWDA